MQWAWCKLARVEGGVCYIPHEKMAQYLGAASEGTRALNLLKKREKQLQELEQIKQKIKEVVCSKIGLIKLCMKIFRTQQ